MDISNETLEAQECLFDLKTSEYIWKHIFNSLKLKIVEIRAFNLSKYHLSMVKPVESE